MIPKLTDVSAVTGPELFDPENVCSTGDPCFVVEGSNENGLVSVETRGVEVSNSRILDGADPDTLEGLDAAQSDGSDSTVVGDFNPFTNFPSFSGNLGSDETTLRNPLGVCRDDWGCPDPN
jgi:hypothetical protein